MKRHLPRGPWTKELLESLSWKQLAEIARYPWRGSKKAAKRRIHKLDRAKNRKETRNP